MYVQNSEHEHTFFFIKNVYILIVCVYIYIEE